MATRGGEGEEEGSSIRTSNCVSPPPSTQASRFAARGATCLTPELILSSAIVFNMKLARGFDDPFPRFERR